MHNTSAQTQFLQNRLSEVQPSEAINSWVFSGDVSTTGIGYFNNALQINNGNITFTGSTFGIYTPVQAQWNGAKALVTYSQYGEIQYNAGQFLNYNALYLKGTSDQKNGLFYSGNFGSTTGFNGPVVFGEDGGALGSSTQSNPWDANGKSVALTWRNSGNVGIGTAAPIAKLDVNGDARISGTLSLSGGDIMVEGKSVKGLFSAYNITTSTGSVCQTINLNPLINGQPSAAWNTCNTAPGRTFDQQGNCTYCTQQLTQSIRFDNPVVVGNNMNVIGQLKLGNNSMYLGSGSAISPGNYIYTDDATNGIRIQSETAAMGPVILQENNAGVVRIGGGPSGSTDNDGFFGLQVFTSARITGSIYTTDVCITPDAFCDYVFDKNYKLKKLSEVEAYIQKYHRLPEAPSEADVIKNGMQLNNIILLQMKKIEELTLYVIEQQKQIDQLKAIVNK
ncbi:MAG: hypothetical protein SFY32_07300 [Bacteroidota bacterium]|nr:hypothetical protein [Bacteroidota bacterium]